MRKLIGLSCCLLLLLSACDEMDDYRPRLENIKLDNNVKTVSDLTEEEQQGLFKNWGEIPQGYILSAKIPQDIRSNEYGDYGLSFRISENKEDLTKNNGYYNGQYMTYAHYINKEGTLMGFIDRNAIGYNSAKTYYYCLLDHWYASHPGLTNDCLDRYSNGTICSDIKSFDVTYTSVKEVSIPTLN